jgi:phage terminase large subunit-like protein
VGYDNIGDNIAVAQAATRRHRFNAGNLKALPLRDVAAATATVAAALDHGTFAHAEDASLTASVLNAVWRESNNSRLLGRKHGKDISPILAGIHALAAASTAKVRTRIKIPEAIAG